MTWVFRLFCCKFGGEACAVTYHVHACLCASSMLVMELSILDPNISIRNYVHGSSSTSSCRYSIRPPILQARVARHSACVYPRQCCSSNGISCNSGQDPLQPKKTEKEMCMGNV